MNPIDSALVAGSVLATAQAAYATSLMLYTWEDEAKHERNRTPSTFEPPHFRFTLLLPARHEEAVIQDTIQQVVDLHYPRELVQVLVVIESGDRGTIAKVDEKIAELAAQGIDNVELVTFNTPPINKPHGLNVGLGLATGDIVTIFDAEDEPHPDILQVVNTVSLREHAPVIQCGVQLMNADDHWFSGLNVLEYFFWFRSRMHHHANVGMVPLGGNTLFAQRALLQEVGGWDADCLTEDADLGIRLSQRGVPIRVLYDDEYVTREETPPSVSQFIKQRTRWDQGFLQVLGKGDWLRLPTFHQRLLALYTLSFPLLQALTLVLAPLAAFTMVTARVGVVASMVSLLPLYLLLTQLVVSVIGLYEFNRVHRRRSSLRTTFWIIVGYLPFQLLLGFSALRATWRELCGDHSWEKTLHVGAHRSIGLYQAEVATHV